MKIVRIADLSEEERKKALQEQQERYVQNEIERNNEIERVNKLFNETYKENTLPIANNGYVANKTPNLWDDIKNIGDNFGKSIGNLAINAYQNIGRRIEEDSTSRSQLLENSTNRALKNSLEQKGYTEEQANKLIENRPTIQSIANNSNVLNNVTNATNKVIQPIENKLQEWKNTNQEKIQKNIENASNPVSKKILELTPSIAQSSVNLVPGGSLLFASGITQDYYEKAINERGLNKDEASKYASIMATLESATELVGAQLTKGVGKAVAKGNIKNALLNFGLDVGENFLEEAVMEPLEELTVTNTAGAEQADWSNMGQRMLQSGIDGALTALLMSGASAGIGKAVNVVDKMQKGQKVTQTEIKEAVQEVKESGIVNTEDIIKNEIQNSMKSLQQQEQLIDKDNNVNPLPTANTQNIAQKAKDILPVVNEKYSVVNQQQANNKIIQQMNKSNQGEILKQIKKDSNNFAKQVDNIKNIKENNDLTVLSRTPQIYLELGADDLPMTVTKNHTVWAMTPKNENNSHFHGISNETIKQLPEALTRPLNIVQSGSDKNSIVAITELADENGAIIIVPIKIQKGKANVNEILIDANALTSIYGKDNDYDGWMKRNIEKDRVLYDIDEGIIKKYRDNTPRLQLPNVITSIDETSSINNSITSSNENVNTTNFTQNEQNYAPRAKKGLNPIEISKSNKEETNFEKYNRYKKNILDRKAKEVNNLNSFKNETIRNIEAKIAEKQQLLESKKDKDTKVANTIKTQIENLKTRKNKIENLYNEKIDKANEKVNKEKINYEVRKTIRQEARNMLKDEIEPLTRDLSLFKDKKTGLQYNRETAQRNIEDIVKDKELAKEINETLFAPIQKHQAQKTREINELFDKINKLDLDRTKKYDYYPSEDTITGKITEAKRMIKIDEATLAQLLIEKKLTDTDLKNTYNLSDKQISKIHTTANNFTEILDYLYEQMNEQQIQYGYSPIGKLENYFPHFFENKPDTMLGKIASYFGIDITRQDLPTEIAGKTDIFKPGKTYNSNTLERKTNKTDYDALKAMQKYIIGATDIIYTTEDIQKLREFERQIRYQYSDKGIQESIDKINNDSTLTQDAKDLAIEGIFNNTENELSNFVTWLNDYTNTLANKKAFADRNMEHNIGRNLYSSMSEIEGRIASNTIGGNLSVSLTNFAPLFQAMGTTKLNYLFTGMLQTTTNDIKGFKGEKDTSFVNNSDFLTNRFGTDYIADRNMTQKISDYASIFMNSIDRFTAESIVRAKYLENIDKGMTEEQSLENADKYAGKIMADRSKGALPIIFNSKNPLSKLATMFQVEPNNIVSNYFKDMPRQAESKTELAKQYTKLMVASYAFNTLIMGIRGGNEVLPDPIRWVSYLIKAIFGEDDDEKEQAKKDLSESIIGSIPFGSNLAGMLGMEDIGRVPISNALPNFSNISKIFDSEKDSKYKKELAIKEFSKPFLYLGLPTGGAQLNKTIQGIATIANGGSYKTNSKGEKELQFPVENANVTDYAKAVVFGKYSLPTAKEYQNRNFKSLTAKQTKEYEESKLPYKEYLEYIDTNLKSNAEKIDYINKQNWSSEQKWAIYSNSLFSKTERQDGSSQFSDAQYITSNGVSKSEYIKTYNEAQKNKIEMPTKQDYIEMKKQGISFNTYIKYKTDLKNESSKTDKDKINILLNSNYSNKEKQALYENYIKESTDKKYDIIKTTGIDINKYLEYKSKGLTTKDAKYNYIVNMSGTTYMQKVILFGLENAPSEQDKKTIVNYINTLPSKTQFEKQEMLKTFSWYK